MKKSILILGAGAAGMSAAMELSKQKDYKLIIIEKNSQVGGLAKTLQFTVNGETFRTDLGPHRFYSKNQYLYSFVEDLLYEEWKLVTRYTRFYVKGKYYLYPIKISNVLKNMSSLPLLNIFADYSKESIKRRIFPNKEYSTFEEYVVAHFGSTLAHFNMINYTEKVWGIQCFEISIDWAKQRIKGLDLLETVKKAILGHSEAKSLVDTFYYPEFGTGTIYEKIQERIIQKGHKVLLHAFPIKIKHKNGQIVSVTTKQNGKEDVYKPTYLISSIPITELIQLFHPLAPKEVVSAASKLRFRSQIYLLLFINKPQVIKDQWIYFPDKEIPFGRISEMKNFSTKMAPADKTSLLVEYFVFENDEMWKKKDEELFDSTIKELEKLKFLKKDEVFKYFVHRQKDVYPIYDLQYKQNLAIIKKWLDTFTNLFYIGRPGRFQYTNQDHSIEMGILAARSIINNKKYDINAIGAEKEYFEEIRKREEE